MTKHSQPSPIIAPGGGRCLFCSNPQPCWAHTEIILKDKAGADIRIPNLPTLLGMLINRLAEIEKRLGPSISVKHEPL